MMSALLINADDFGLHESINQAITECVEYGTVNSISIAANGNAMNFASLRAMEKQRIFTGAHLTWVGEKWITDHRVIPDWKALLKTIATQGKPFLSKMKTEAEAQINYLLENNITLDHLDSHQHIHHLPRVWAIAQGLQKKYSIPRIRITQAPSLSLIRHSVSGLALQTLAQLQQKQAAFLCIGLKHTGSYTSTQLIAELVESQENNIELIVHPGKNNHQLNTIFPHWQFNWENEYNALLNPHLLTTIKENSFTLIRKT